MIYLWVILVVLTTVVSGFDVVNSHLATALIGYTPLSLVDNAQLHPMAAFDNICAYGGTAIDYEGLDEPKAVVYEYSRTEVSFDEFEKKLNATGLTLGFFSRANRRNYPNQDNFLVDVFLDSYNKPLFGLYALWDGHGECGHVLSEFFRGSVQHTWRVELQDFLDQLAKTGSILKQKLERRERMKSIVKNLFYVAQEQYDMHMLYFDQRDWSAIAKLLESYPSFIDEKACKRSGATMSVTFVDYADHGLYTGNLGDSPIYGKFKNNPQLQTMFEDHSMSNRAERDKAVAKFKKDRMEFVLRERMAIRSGGSLVYYKWRQKPGEEKELHHEIREIGFYLYPPFIFDFRLNGLQMGRALGHWNDATTYVRQPYVHFVDLVTDPLEYIIMGSDGLTHRISSMSLDYTQQGEVMNAQDWETMTDGVASGRRQEKAMQTEVQKAFYKMDRRELKEDVSMQELEEFSAAYEALQAEADKIQLHILQHVVESHSGTNTTGLFNSFYQLSRPNNMQRDGSDDITVISLQFRPERDPIHPVMEAEEIMLTGALRRALQMPSDANETADSSGRSNSTSWQADLAPPGRDRKGALPSKQPRGSSNVPVRKIKPSEDAQLFEQAINAFAGEKHKLSEAHPHNALKEEKTDRMLDDKISVATHMLDDVDDGSQSKVTLGAKQFQDALKALELV